MSITVGIELDNKDKECPSQVIFGYRYFHADDEDDLLAIEVDIKGPLVGFGLEFQVGPSVGGRLRSH